MRLAINDLLPSTGYAIQVRATDGASQSEWSTIYDLTTSTDSIAPNTPGGVTWVVSGDSFHGEWNPVSTNVSSQVIPITRYEVQLVVSGITKQVAVTPDSGVGKVSFDLSFEANRALFNGTPRAAITMSVRAVDNKELKSGYSTGILATNPVPGNPTSVTAAAAADAIGLSWTPPADLDLIGYNIYNTADVKVGFTSGTTYVHSTTTYTLQTMRVAAVDKFGQESSHVAANAVTPNSPFTNDTTPPAVPASLAASITNATDGLSAWASVTWGAVADSDLAGYVVRWFQSSPSVGTWREVTYTKENTAVTINLPTAYATYQFQIRSFDKMGNYSTWSTPAVTASATANAAPANVTGLTASAGKDNITYSWAAVADTDIKNYEVTFATNSGFTTGVQTFLTGTSTSVSVGGLTPGTTYYARVRAVDTGGLTSAAWSATNTQATKAYSVQVTDGVVPASSPAAIVVGKVGFLSVKWAPIVNNDLVRYEVHLSTTSGFTPTLGGATRCGEVYGTSFDITTLPGTTTALTYGTTYYVRILAVDADGAGPAGTQGSGTPVKVAAGDSTLTAGDVGAATPAYVQSRGMQMITNGNGILTTNYNFSQFTFLQGDMPEGAVGYFARPAGAYTTPSTDEYVPVDPTKSYTFSFLAKQLGNNSASQTLYSFLFMYDVGNNVISSTHHMYRAGTTTTLAAPLNPGDTTVTLTNSAGWNSNTTNSAYQLGIIFWDYTDATGKTWPTQTYSRNVYPSLWTFNTGAINFTTHVITLAAPWAGPAKPAGTSVSNAASGGSYKYQGAVNALVPTNAWTLYKGGYSGVDYTGQNVQNQFTPGTAKVRFGWLMNYPTGTGSQHAVANVYLSEITAGNLPEIAIAQASANGKNKVIYSTSAASGTAHTDGIAFKDGDSWFQMDTLAAGGKVIAQWQYQTATNTWRSNTLRHEVIASVDAGVMLAGSTFTNSLNVKSVFTLGDAGTPGVIKSYNHNTGTKTGFSLSSAGLEIWQGKVSAGTLEANTSIINNLIIGTGGSLTSSNWSSGTAGWRISQNGAEFNDSGTSIKVETLKGGTMGGSGGAGTIQIAVGTDLVMNGGAFRSNSYGSSTYNPAASAGFFISNGNIHIPQGNVSASAFSGGTFNAGTINMALGGVIQSVGYTGVAGSGGFRLDHTGLQIPDGTLGIAKIVVGSNSIAGTAITSIAGDKITTGSIMADAANKAKVYINTPLYDSNGVMIGFGNRTEIDDPAGRRAWQIDIAGNATFSKLQVLGNAVLGYPGVEDTTFTYSTTASTTNGSNQVQFVAGTVQDADEGSVVTAAGIPGGTTIVAVNMSTSMVTMSANATATASNVTITWPRQARYTSSLSSANFVEGSNGWSLRSDGTAEFRRVVANSLHGSAVQFGTLSAETLKSGVVNANLSLAGSFETSQSPSEMLFTFTNASTTVTTSATDVELQFKTTDVGVTITGPGIRPETTIVAYVSATQVTISQATTAAATDAEGAVYRGRRVRMSGESGITLSDALGNPVITLPTDPNENPTFTGTIVTNDLFVQDEFRMFGQNNSLGQNAIFTMNSGTYVPSSYPRVTYSWDNRFMKTWGDVTYAPGNDPYINDPRGLVWDSTAKKYYYTFHFWGPYMARTWGPGNSGLVADGTNDNNVSLAGGINGNGAYNNLALGGVAISGTNFYFLCKNLNTNGWNLQGVTRTGIERATGPVNADNVMSHSWADQATQGGMTGNPVMTIYGGSTFIAKKRTDGRLVLYKYANISVSGAPDVVTTKSEVISGEVQSITVGKLDMGGVDTYVMVTANGPNGKQAYTYKWTGSAFTSFQSYNFPIAYEESPIGLCWVGTNTDDSAGEFRSITLSGRIASYTGVLRSTNATNFKVKMAWRNSTAGTTGTAGPTGTYGVKRRARITMTSPNPIPNSGGSSPNALTFYLGTDSGTMWRYAEPAAGVITSTYTSLLTGDAATTGVAAMPNGTPAKILAGSNIEINASGYIFGQEVKTNNWKRRDNGGSATSTSTNWVKVTGYTNDYNVGPAGQSNISISSGELIAVKSGYYHIDGMVRFAQGASATFTRRTMRLEKNNNATLGSGTLIAQVESPGNNVGPTLLSGSDVVYVAAGEGVRIVVFQNAGANIAVDLATLTMAMIP